jgi:hypothetical protein
MRGSLSKNASRCNIASRPANMAVWVNFPLHFEADFLIARDVADRMAALAHAPRNVAAAGSRLPYRVGQLFDPLCLDRLQRCAVPKSKLMSAVGSLPDFGRVKFLI